FKSTTSTDSDSVCSNSLAANGSNRRVQSTSQDRTALCTLATHHSGQGGFPDVPHHPRFPCHDARDGPTHGKLGSGNVAEKGGYQVDPWECADSEPREARKVRLRVLRSDPGGQVWRWPLASRRRFQAGRVNTAGKATIDKILDAMELCGNSMPSPAPDNISSQCLAACRQNLFRKLAS